MKIDDDYPDFSPIQVHIRRAQAERTVHIAHLIATAIDSLGRGLRRIGTALGNGLAAERDQRAVEADAFLRRSVPKY